ncbi:MAG: ATP-grasp domain-containing protein [Bacillota bacterium]
MKFITFDPFRAAGIPDVTYIKPEMIFAKKDLIQEADWILFPEYWQVNLLHYVWKKNIFPSINTYHLGHDKVEMTRALQAAAPQHVPNTLITANITGAKDVIQEQFSYPFVAKEIRNSMGRGVHLVTKAEELRDYIDKNEVLYIQEYLPIDRDLRLVLIGNKVVFSYWRVGQGSFKNNVAQGGAIDFLPTPREAVELVESLAANLGIDHAGFDLALVEDYPYFFEFNVMFGNQALVQANVPIGKYILDYINEKSCPQPPKPWIPTPKAS